MSDTSKIFLRNTPEEILDEIKDYLPVPEGVKDILGFLMWAFSYTRTSTFWYMKVYGSISMTRFTIANEATGEIIQLEYNNILPGNNKFRLSVSR